MQNHYRDLFYNYESGEVFAGGCEAFDIINLREQRDFKKWPAKIPAKLMTQRTQ